MIFFFPYNPPTPLPRQTPRPSHREKLDFSPFQLRFGSVRLRLARFWVCFGSISGPFRGVGWGRGGVEERGFCKGKEYHYANPHTLAFVERTPTRNVGSRTGMLNAFFGALAPGGASGGSVHSSWGCKFKVEEAHLLHEKWPREQQK